MDAKLVMTLLVRDEEDILENNICFHLSHGVDHIVAIDNDSTDGTRDILDKYKRAGVLSYTVVKDHTYMQSQWVSQMAQSAVKDHDATHLFHCDADEFWMPTTGNLKSYLPLNNEVFYVRLLNYLPSKKRSFWSQKRSVVTNPYSTPAFLGAVESYRYLLHMYHPKVMTTSAFTKIAQGNHLVTDRRPQQRVDVEHLLIHHFPIRTYAQFERKVVNGGSSYERNPDKSPQMGWQWKKWYELYNHGLLRDTYNLLCMDEEKKVLEYEGVIATIKIPRSIAFASLLYKTGLRTKIEFT